MTKSFQRASIALATLLLAGTPAAMRAAVLPPLDLKALREQVSLADPRMSPDGKTIALVVRKQDFDADKSRGRIVLVDVATGRQTPVTRTSDSASSPRWSPSGDRLAFIATPHGDDPKAPGASKSQLAVITLGSGDPETLTASKTGVQSFAWSPDGRTFVFLAADEAPNQKEIDKKDDGFDVDDNAWNVTEAPVPSHLWTIASSGGTATRLTKGEWTAQREPAWSPDGRRIVFTRYPSAHTEHYASARIASADPRTGTVTVLTEQNAEEPVFSADGKRLAFGIQNASSFSQTDIAVAAPDATHARDATVRLDRNAETALFTPDGNALLVVANDRTRTRLFHVDIASGASHAVALGDVNVTGGISTSRDGTLAFVGSTPAHPSELYVLAPHASAPRRLTNLNAFADRYAVGPSRTIAWRSADGFDADGVLTEPPGGIVKGKRYPLVLVIHGGPTSTSTTAWSALAQLMAARGWLVFQPNYRGSDNLGAKFAQATVPHITSAPAQDVEDGLAAVLREGIVDETRIGVSGWSEGGLMTSWLIAHDTRWKAAMSGAAVNDWLMYADMTDAQDFTPYFIGPKSPWVDDATRALYTAESPLTYADRVKTKTLIMTDAGDQRVPEPLAYMFYHAIRATGTPVQMVVIPVDGHFPIDPVRREDVTRRWVEWFAQNL